MVYELQDPDGEPDYTFDWNDWLPSDDTIASHVLSVSPTGPTVNDLGELDGFIAVRVGAVAYGKIYRVTCKVTTSAGEKAVRSIEIRGGHR
jgi:hypothetical protein